MWKDRLKIYDGKSITYDKIGNPVTYLGMTMTWTQGRRLSTLTKSGVKSVYTYNADGLRTSKKIGGGKQINYIWEGSKLICQENGSASARMIFVYDATGEVSGLTYGSAKYMFIKNLQGDVTAIMDSTGHIVVRYVYDTWGKLISIKDGKGVNVTNASHIGRANPIRYRSYYYDTETGLYYLQQRYYDPETGRFINADRIAGNSGNSEYNLFVYCANNPVNNSDPTGEFVLTAFLICVAVGVVVSLVGKYVEDVTYNSLQGKTGWDRWTPTSSWEDYAASGITGGIMGGISYFAPTLSPLAKNAMDALLKPTIKQSLEIASGKRTHYDFVDMAVDAGIRFGTSYLKVPGTHTPIKKIIGNWPSNVARGGTKYLRKDVIPSYGPTKPVYGPTKPVYGPVKPIYLR